MIILIVVILILLILAIWLIATSNGLKRRQIKVQEGLSGIEVALTKRYDMLTKLLDVAKGYMAHERELFTQVVQLRQGMSIREMGEASAKMDEVSARVFAVAEGYPQLRSGDVFVQLEHGIRDAEDHLQAARRLYNANVSAYNAAIAVFPASIIANAQNRVPLEFFEAEAEKRQDVKMSF